MDQTGLTEKESEAEKRFGEGNMALKASQEETQPLKMGMEKLGE